MIGGGLAMLVLLAFLALLSWGPARSAEKRVQSRQNAREAQRLLTARRQSLYVVLGYNDLGMHCMNQNFSELCILPPFNTLHAQVIRRGEEPQIIASGANVRYALPNNTDSTSKTNFWDYAPALFGVQLPANVGLTGNGLKGLMKPTGDNDFSATGIPLTPILDDGSLDPYQLANINVVVASKSVAFTKAVVPVSWEISCNICHTTPGISVETDILRKHDKLHPKHADGTPMNLEASKPVLCAACHADPALGTQGVPGVKAMSHAMHGAHAKRMRPALDVVGKNTCYACHPGNVTNCQRDIHVAKGMHCFKCHGGMADVGDEKRTPWVSEPSCGSCHAERRPTWQFEEKGKLYRNSRGHGGVHCAACHGSPHAITPTVTDADNVQAIMHQGFPGTIKKCTVCHTKVPDDPFPHRLFGEGVENENEWEGD